MRVYKSYDYDSPTTKFNGIFQIHKGNYVNKMTIPYMSEGLFSTGTTMYLIFESAANKYMNGTDNKGVVPSDMVCDCFCKLNFYRVAVE